MLYCSRKLQNVPFLALRLTSVQRLNVTCNILDHFGDLKYHTERAYKYIHAIITIIFLPLNSRMMHDLPTSWPAPLQKDIKVMRTETTHTAQTNYTGCLYWDYFSV